MDRLRALTVVAACLLFSALAPEARAQTVDDLFDDSVLQRIDLWVNTKDWSHLVANFTTNDFYPANLQWRGLTARNVGIRSRGTGSRSQSKPGLRVVFDHYTTGQRFLGLKALVLKNLVQDASLVREPLAMKFMRRMGLSAPRESLAAVYVDNTYMGVYSIVEEFNEVALQRLFGESNGYLFEYKWNFDYHLEYLGSDLSVYAPLFSPATHENDSSQALYGPIEAMVRTINTAPDDTFLSAMSEYLDLNLFIRHVAVEDFVADWDGILGYAGLNNFYLYRFTGRNLSQFLPWDKDNSFHSFDYPIRQGQNENVLTRRIWLVSPELRQLYFDTLQACVDSADEPAADAIGGPGWLERELTRMQALISPAASGEQFAAGAAAMLDIVQKRTPFVRCELARARGTSLPPACGPS
jgi:spore coat protein H